MRQATQQVAFFLTVIGIIGVTTLSVHVVEAQRKTGPEPRRIPTPLTQKQVRQIFPGTTGSVALRPDAVTLYIIDPSRLYRIAPKPLASRGESKPANATIDGYTITGRIAITDRTEQARLLASAFYTREGRAFQGNCFEPHHVLRLVKNKRIVDVIICFGCGNTQIWENGTPKTGDLPANWAGARYVAAVLAKHRLPQHR